MTTRMRLRGLCCCAIVVPGCLQADDEGSALANRLAEAQVAALTFRERRGDAQADALTARLRAARAPLEQLLADLRRDARSGVGDLDLDAVLAPVDVHPG